MGRALNFTPRFRANNWYGFILPALYFRRALRTPSQLCPRGTDGAEFYLVLWRWEARFDVWWAILPSEEARKRFGAA